MKNKPSWEDILKLLIVVLFIAILGLLVFLKIWVIVEYGDMPISEVPSWAIPWLTYGGR